MRLIQAAALSLVVGSAAPTPAHIVFPTAPQTVSVLRSQSLTLECVLSGSPHTHVLWTKDGQELLAGENHRLLHNNLVLVAARKGDAGSYRCLYQTEAGEELGANYTVRVLGRRPALPLGLAWAIWIPHLYLTLLFWPRPLSSQSLHRCCKVWPANRWPPGPLCASSAWHRGTRPPTSPGYLTRTPSCPRPAFGSLGRPSALLLWCRRIRACTSAFWTTGLALPNQLALSPYSQVCTVMHGLIGVVLHLLYPIPFRNGTGKIL